MIGDQGWADELPRRHTIVMLRSDHKIPDLDVEDFSQPTKAQAHRPSHVMLCVFCRKSIPRSTHGKTRYKADSRCTSGFLCFG